MIPFAYLPHRAIVSLSGADVSELLERLLTNRVDDQKPGEARYTALLTPQGKIISDFFLVRDHDRWFIDCPSAIQPDLVKRLNLFKLRADVSIDLLEGWFAIASTEDMPKSRGNITGSHVMFQDPRTDAVRFRAVCEPTEWSSWHGPHPSEWAQPINAFHADRISLSLPEWGFDFSNADAFPADINMDLSHGVDLKKGCFVGQEVVSRMHRRGNIRKRTLGLSVTNTVTVGDDVHAGEVNVGSITSVEGTHALARIRTDRLATALPDDQVLTVAGDPAILQISGALNAELQGAKE